MRCFIGLVDCPSFPKLSDDVYCVIHNVCNRFRYYTWLVKSPASSGQWPWRCVTEWRRPCGESQSVTGRVELWGGWGGHLLHQGPSCACLQVKVQTNVTECVSCISLLLVFCLQFWIVAHVLLVYTAIKLLHCCSHLIFGPNMWVCNTQKSCMSIIRLRFLIQVSDLWLPVFLFSLYQCGLWQKKRFCAFLV